MYSAKGEAPTCAGITLLTQPTCRYDDPIYPQLTSLAIKSEITHQETRDFEQVAS